MDYFPMWYRYYPMFKKKKLTSSQLGDLVWAMMEYKILGKEPEELDTAVSVFWLFIQQDLDRAQLKYDQAVANGKKGGRPKKATQKPEETPSNLKKQRTTTKTKSTTASTSVSTTETSSSDAACGEDVSLCQNTHGEYGWVRLTNEQYRQLEEIMGPQQLQQCIAYIDRSAQSTGNRNQWQDWALVLKRCYEGRWHEVSPKKDPVPMGASGNLGEAELEAIQRVLRCGM